MKLPRAKLLRLPRRKCLTLPRATNNGAGEKKEINILLLEDNDADADLIYRALRSSGLVFRLDSVDSKAAYVQRLDRHPPDLILSDSGLPGFDGYAALRLALEKCPEVPFIVVTGALGDEKAIEALNRGATDYVLKAQLSELAPAVNRVLREAREREDRQHFEERLQRSQKRLRTLSVRLQNAREEERMHIAHLVRDELGQTLTGLKLQLLWLKSRLPQNAQSLHRKASMLDTQMAETIRTASRIATELHPGVLDSAGLPGAIEWQAREFERQTGILCHVQTPVGETNWGEKLNTAFFRIFQDALNNIFRQTGATHLEVALKERGDDIVMEMKDDGRHSSDAGSPNNKSIRLQGMREWARLLGGKVLLHREPGKGSTVAVHLPRQPSPPREHDWHENSPGRRSHPGKTGA